MKKIINKIRELFGIKPKPFHLKVIIFSEKYYYLQYYSIKKRKYIVLLGYYIYHTKPKLVSALFTYNEVLRMKEGIKNEEDAMKFNTLVHELYKKEFKEYQNRLKRLNEEKQDFLKLNKIQ